MRERFRTIIIIATVVILVVVGVLIVFARGSLRQAGGRTCLGCVEWHWSGSSSIRANRLSGEYVFTRPREYLIEFEGGDIRLNDRPLDTGCHVGIAESGTRVRFDDARDVQVRAPRGDATCDSGGPPAAVP